MSTVDDPSQVSEDSCPYILDIKIVCTMLISRCWHSFLRPVGRPSTLLSASYVMDWCGIWYNVWQPHNENCLCRDYRAMPALDRYDPRDIDDEEVPETFEEREAARLRAERELDQAQGRRRTRLPGALLEGGVLSACCKDLTNTLLETSGCCLQLGHRRCVILYGLCGCR